MNERLELIKQRLSNSSPGPWHAVWNDVNNRAEIKDERGKTIIRPKYNDFDIDEDDKEFIVEAKEDIRYLLDMLKMSMDECDLLKEQVRDLRRYRC